MSVGKCTSSISSTELLSVSNTLAITSTDLKNRLKCFIRHVLLCMIDLFLEWSERRGLLNQLLPLHFCRHEWHTVCSFGSPHSLRMHFFPPFLLLSFVCCFTASNNKKGCFLKSYPVIRRIDPFKFVLFFFFQFFFIFCHSHPKRTSLFSAALFFV